MHFSYHTRQRKLVHQVQIISTARHVSILPLTTAGQKRFSNLNKTVNKYLAVPMTPYTYRFVICYFYLCTQHSLLAQGPLLCNPCASFPPQHYLQLLAKLHGIYLSHYFPAFQIYSHAHSLLSKRHFLASLHTTQPATRGIYND